jgi:WD40 repeat protein
MAAALTSAPYHRAQANGSFIAARARVPTSSDSPTETSECQHRPTSSEPMGCVCTVTLAERNKNVTCIAFSPDGKLLATCTTKLWCALDGHCAATIAGHGSYSGVKSVAFSPDGALLATGSADCTGILWRVADGVCAATACDLQSFLPKIRFLLVSAAVGKVTAAFLSRRG